MNRLVIIFGILSSIFVLQACEKEVLPLEDTSGILMPSEQVQSLAQVCTPPDTFKLATSDGGFKVSYCGWVPCIQPQEDWGEARIYHGLDSSQTEVLVMEFVMTWGWYITEVEFMTDSVQNFSLGRGGVPQIGPNWTQQVEINVPSQCEVSCGVPGSGCFSLGTKLKVCKLDFFGGVDPGSQMELWVWYEEWNTAPTLSGLSLSPMLLPYCPNPCPA